MAAAAAVSGAQYHTNWLCLPHLRRVRHPLLCKATGRQRYSMCSQPCVLSNKRPGPSVPVWSNIDDGGCYNEFLHCSNELELVCMLMDTQHLASDSVPNGCILCLDLSYTAAEA
jgi:hypothetical protein